MNVSNGIYFVGVALFIVWMQRHKRWQAFFGALEGNVDLVSGP